jgi:hypothetical protein
MKMTNEVNKEWDYMGNYDPVLRTLAESGIGVSVNNGITELECQGKRYQMSSSPSIKLNTRNEEQETLLLLTVGDRVVLKSVTPNTHGEY